MFMIAPYDFGRATSYFEIIQQAEAERRNRQKLNSMKSSSTAAMANVSFREVVESFAEQNGIEFVPKIGKQIDGKQIFMFANASIYIEHDVVFCNLGGTSSWSPIALEDLLQIVQR